MDELMVMLVPAVLAWVGLSRLTGASLSPVAVTVRIARLQWRLLRLLIQGRCQRSGAARVQRPHLRYWDPAEGDR